MSSELQLAADFEAQADATIDQYFSKVGVVKDVIEVEEKKLIVKQLALANKKSEIVSLLNRRRLELSLPELRRDFDIHYYAREYAPLIEDISLHYAANLAKKYRFANRITRIAKLNEVAESVLDRINARNEKQESGESLGKEEAQHNENIRLFSLLVNTIDEQMGKLKLTKIDLNVRSSDKPVLDNPGDLKKLIEDALTNKFRDQLPSSVDANFTDITDYQKCEFGEEWSAQTHCQYHEDQCKVQTGEVKLCPFFVNKVLLNSRDWCASRYVKDGLSVRQVAEIAGSKETNDKVLERVRGKLKRYGLYRASGDSAN